MFEGMYSSWTAPNTSRPPCMEPWRPSLHIPKKNWFDRCITFLKTKIEHVEHHPTLKIGCSFAMAIFRFCFAFHRCRDGEWCCAIQGPNAGLFQSCAWSLPLPASEMRTQPSFLVLGRRQALGGKPCGMKVGSTFGRLPYSYLFIHIHPIWLLIFFGSGGQSSWAIHVLQRYMAGCLEMLGETWPNWPKPVLAADWPIIGPLTRHMSYLCQNSTPSLGHYWPNVSVWGENSAWLHEFPARWTMLGSGLRKQGRRRIPFASWLSMLHSTRTFQTLCVECVWHVLTKCLQVKQPDP